MNVVKAVTVPQIFEYRVGIRQRPEESQRTRVLTRPRARPGPEAVVRDFIEHLAGRVALALLVEQGRRQSNANRLSGTESTRMPVLFSSCSQSETKPSRSVVCSITCDATM